MTRGAWKTQERPNPGCGHRSLQADSIRTRASCSAKQPGRKRDLRKVEEWLKAKRRAEQLKRENEGSGED